MGAAGAPPRSPALLPTRRARPQQGKNSAAPAFIQATQQSCCAGHGEGEEGGTKIKVWKGHFCVLGAPGGSRNGGDLGKRNGNRGTPRPDGPGSIPPVLAGFLA